MLKYIETDEIAWVSNRTSLWQKTIRTIDLIKPFFKIFLYHMSIVKYTTPPNNCFETEFMIQDKTIAKSSPLWNQRWIRIWSSTRSFTKSNFVLGKYCYHHRLARYATIIHFQWAVVRQDSSKVCLRYTSKADQWDQWLEMWKQGPKMYLWSYLRIYSPWNGMSLQEDYQEGGEGVEATSWVPLWYNVTNNSFICFFAVQVVLLT